VPRQEITSQLHLSILLLLLLLLLLHPSTALATTAAAPLWPPFARPIKWGHGQCGQVVLHHWRRRGARAPGKQAAAASAAGPGGGREVCCSVGGLASAEARGGGSPAVPQCARASWAWLVFDTVAVENTNVPTAEQ
jgi:hypothetical protein